MDKRLFRALSDTTRHDHQVIRYLIKHCSSVYIAKSVRYMLFEKTTMTIKKLALFAVVLLCIHHQVRVVFTVLVTKEYSSKSEEMNRFVFFNNLFQGTKNICIYGELFLSYKCIWCECTIE